MDELHRRLLRIGFDAGADLNLVLAGGYALAAHDLVDRPSRDIDFATSTALPLPEVAARLARAYEDQGFSTRVVEATPRMARLVVSQDDMLCEVDLLKEAIGPPSIMSIGPVLAFDDAIGLKVRALYDRAAHRDFIDIHAASHRLTRTELEALGARHTVGFSLDELADRLGAVPELDDWTFEGYGLDEAQITRVRQWAIGWETDIRARLAAGEVGPTGPEETAWDTYLDRT
jgi:hypothetical protein